MAELAGASDAVAVARALGSATVREVIVDESLAGAADTRELGTARFVDVDLVVDQVLHGSVDHAHDSVVVLEMYIPSGVDADAIAHTVPNTEVVLFLHFKLDPGNDRYYRATNIARSLFIRIGDLVTPRFVGQDDWTRSWEEVPYDQLAAAIEGLR
jgi:hypothetical protein